jgi:hypothetical protein
MPNGRLRDDESVVHRGLDYARVERDRHLTPNEMPPTLEVAFAEEWERENVPQPGLNQGHGVLQNLMCEPNSHVLRETITQRDASIVATAIQWLGTNVGRAFLQSVFGQAEYTLGHPGSRETMNEIIEEGVRALARERARRIAASEVAEALTIRVGTLEREKVALLEELGAKQRENVTLLRELEYNEPPDLVAPGAPQGSNAYHVGQSVGDWMEIGRAMNYIRDMAPRVFAFEIRRIPRPDGGLDMIQARHIVRRRENDDAE